ncbi:hypothetical protein CR513_47734, partial [Mucuna pruriens]
MESLPPLDLGKLSTKSMEIPTQGLVEIGIDKDQWARFVCCRKKPSILELFNKNKEIRSKQVIPYTSDSKPNSRRRKKRYNNSESTFKTYMIKKKGRIPEELANFFTLGSQ